MRMRVYTIPVLSSTSPVYFNLSNLLLPLCSPIWPSLCLLTTSPHCRDSRAIQMLREVKVVPSAAVSSPLFIIVL